MKYPDSNCITPWVLVRRGDSVPGKKQRLQFVYITEWAFLVGGRANHVGHVVRRDGSLTKTPRKFPKDSVRSAWRDRPSEADIKRFKDSLLVKG